MFQMAVKCTKWPLNIPTNILHCHIDPQKFTQIGVFGLKIGHLATPSVSGTVLKTIREQGSVLR
jgi:hypothetical protein